MVVIVEYGAVPNQSTCGMKESVVCYAHTSVRSVFLRRKETNLHPALTTHTLYSDDNVTGHTRQEYFIPHFIVFVEVTALQYVCSVEPEYDDHLCDQNV
jgi:hypothetical protein